MNTDGTQHNMILGNTGGSNSASVADMFQSVCVSLNNMCTCGLCSIESIKYIDFGHVINH